MNSGPLSTTISLGEPCSTQIVQDAADVFAAQRTISLDVWGIPREVIEDVHASRLPAAAGHVADNFHGPPRVLAGRCLDQLVVVHEALPVYRRRQPRTAVAAPLGGQFLQAGLQGAVIALLPAQIAHRRTRQIGQQEGRPRAVLDFGLGRTG